MMQGDWVTREIYSDSPALSFSMTNVPFYAMLFRTAELKFATPGQLVELLHYIGCFFDTDDGFEQQKAKHGKNWTTTKTYRTVRDYSNRCSEMRATLRPSKM